MPFLELEGLTKRFGGAAVVHDLSLAVAKGNLSMIFQSYALWPHMTVFDNVAYGLMLRKLPRPDVRRRADEILAATRLSPLAQRYPGELSGGQQQRVSLARAQVVEPETLLRLSADRPAGETNAVQGTVTRQVYLGSHRDDLVAVPGGNTLRAQSPAALDIAPGSPVWLHLRRNTAGRWCTDPFHHARRSRP